MSATEPSSPDDHLDDLQDTDIHDMGVHEKVDDDAEGLPLRYECPQCRQQVAGVPEPLSPFLTCPHCGTQFTAADELPPTDDPAELDARDRKQACGDELSELRIKQLSRHRRATIRTRSHVLVGFLIFLCACGKLFQMAVREMRRAHALNFRSAGLLLFAAAALFPAWYFLRRTRQISQELKKPIFSDPTTPPDFSTLQDGSQQAKNLENM